ncbi:MAG: hypothetical protein PHW82_08430 [Bacteroidales bacterium]|nr:hypothetical protein [Bacteroidales bacterium]
MEIKTKNHNIIIFILLLTSVVITCKQVDNTELDNLHVGIKYNYQIIVGKDTSYSSIVIFKKNFEYQSYVYCNVLKDYNIENRSYDYISYYNKSFLGIEYSASGESLLGYSLPFYLNVGDSVIYLNDNRINYTKFDSATYTLQTFGYSMFDEIYSYTTIFGQGKIVNHYSSKINNVVLQVLFDSQDIMIGKCYLESYQFIIAENKSDVLNYSSHKKLDMNRTYISNF